MKKFALSLVAASMIFFGNSVRAEETAPAKVAGYCQSVRNYISSNCVATWIKANPKKSVGLSALVVAAYVVYKAYQAAQEEEVTSANFTTSSK